MISKASTKDEKEIISGFDFIEDEFLLVVYQV
jgi:hypothetical protein